MTFRKYNLHVVMAPDEDCSAAPIPNRSDGTVQATGTDEHLVGDEKTFVATNSTRGDDVTTAVGKNGDVAKEGDGMCAGGCGQVTPALEQTSCEGSGEPQQTSCEGRGEPQQTSCEGSGEPPQTSCEGRGEPQQTSCEGSGEPQQTSCEGSGEPPQTSCEGSGEPQQTSCEGSGEPQQTSCEGSGEPQQTSLCENTEP